jgi:hypothetical protein
MSPISVAQKSLSLSEIKAKAKTLGVNVTNKMKKAELVHAIQVAEGCTPCYGRSNGNCQWTQCCWRSDCHTAKV